MDIIALVAGLIISVLIILLFRSRNNLLANSTYPFLLLTFPFYYIFFALLARDYHAMQLEIAFGLLFIALATFSIKLCHFNKLVLLATGYILHGIYDVLHNLLFINLGTPNWWPEFCGIIDITLGTYLVIMAFRFKAEYA